MEKFSVTFLNDILIIFESLLFNLFFWIPNEKVETIYSLG